MPVQLKLDQHMCNVLQMYTIHIKMCCTRSNFLPYTSEAGKMANSIEWELWKLSNIKGKQRAVKLQL